MNDLLELMIDQGASDLHIEVNQPPTLRISGSMVPVEGPNLDPQGAEALMKSITSETNQEQVKATGGADFGFAYQSKARFRVSVLRAKGHYGLVLRQIPNDLFSLGEYWPARYNHRAIESPAWAHPRNGTDGFG